MPDRWRGSHRVRMSAFVFHDLGADPRQVFREFALDEIDQSFADEAAQFPRPSGIAGADEDAQLHRAVRGVHHLRLA